MTGIDRRTAATAAVAGVVGSAVAAAPSLGLLGAELPRRLGVAVAAGRLLVALAVVLVAAWFTGERDGPAGFVAVVAALLAVVAAVAAAVVSSSALGGTAAVAAGRVGLVATAVFFLAVGAAAADDRLTPAGQRAAVLVGVLSVGAALLPALRPVAFVGWAGWFAWLGVRLVARATR